MTNRRKAKIASDVKRYFALQSILLREFGQPEPIRPSVQDATHLPWSCSGKDLRVGDVHHVVAEGPNEGPSFATAYCVSTERHTVILLDMRKKKTGNVSQ